MSTCFEKTGFKSFRELEIFLDTDPQLEEDHETDTYQNGNVWGCYIHFCLENPCPFGVATN